MENFGTAPDVFLQCYGRYDEQSQPKTDQKIQQSSPTPQVAAVPCVVLAVFVAASSDRLKLEAYDFGFWLNGTGIFREMRACFEQITPGGKPL